MKKCLLFLSIIIFAIPITSNAIPSVNANFTSNSVTGCNGNGNGTIAFTNPTGGSGSYQYSIDGGNTWSFGPTFTALYSRNYNLQVRDANSPSSFKVLNASFYLPQPSPLTASVTSINASGCGNSDGILLISNPAGGSGGYQYQVDGGYWQSSATISGLATGYYNVGIRDQSYCNGQVGTFFVGNNETAVTFNTATKDISSCGGVDGGITISGVSGGIGSYQYSIDKGNTWSNSTIFSNLNSGQYSIQVKSSNTTSCISSKSVYLNQPNSLSALYTTSIVSSCGGTDGVINVYTISGGSGLYEYSINGGNTWGPNSYFSGLNGNNSYSLLVRDSLNKLCSYGLNYNILLSSTANINAQSSVTNVSACGANDGIIVITGVTGGSNSYKYSIDNGITFQNTATFTGLSANFYGGLVQDANNPSCNHQFGINVTQPGGIVGTANYTPISSCGHIDGSITITGVSGGSGLYLYSINVENGDWQNSNIFSSLPGFNYQVAVRDSINKSCLTYLGNNLNLGGSGGITSSSTYTVPSSCNATDGLAIISASGGSGLFQYSKDNGNTWQSSATFTGLAAGSYGLYARDSTNKSCTYGQNVYIGSNGSVSANYTSIDPSSCGAQDGAFVFYGASGGSGTYSYSVDGGKTWSSSATISGLASNVNYDLAIADALHLSCLNVLRTGYQLHDINGLQAAPYSKDVSSCGANDGIIALLNPSGGSGFYDYTIDGGIHWLGIGTYTGLAPGVYKIEMRDQQKITCTAGGTVTLTAPGIVTASVTSTTINCGGAATGKIIFINPSGSTNGYQYTVNGGILWTKNTTITGLRAGTYNVQIRDSVNTSCVNVLNSGFVLQQQPPIQLTVIKDSVDKAITIVAAGGVAPFQYRITNGSYSTNNTFSGLNINQKYTFYAKDNNGCVKLVSDSLKVNSGGITSTASNQVSTLGLYPNPNSGKFSIDLTAYQGSDASLSIYNVAGFKVYENNVSGTSSIENIALDLTEGIYYILVQSDQKTDRVKFIVK